MALSTIRKMDDTDMARINASATKWLKRHLDIDFTPSDYQSAYDRVMQELETAYPEDSKKMERSWLGCFRRATKTNGDTVAYGYIGYSVE